MRKDRSNLIQCLNTVNQNIRRFEATAAELAQARTSGGCSSFIGFNPEIIAQLAAARELQKILVQEVGRMERSRRGRPQLVRFARSWR